MKIRRHSAVLIAVVALGALASTSLAGATSATAVPTRHLAAEGGTVTWAASVKEARWCVWSSSPKVPKFNATVKCKTGRVTRSAKFQANTSTKAKDYTLTLTVIGNTTTVDHLKVMEAGRSVTATTTSTTTTMPKATAATVRLCKQVVTVDDDLVSFWQTDTGESALLAAVANLKTSSQNYGQPFWPEYLALLTGMTAAPPWTQTNAALRAYAGSCRTEGYEISVEMV